MLSVNLTVEMTEEVEEKARAAGLLTGEKIAELIEAELERQREEAWSRLSQIMGELQEASREDFGDLSDDEFMNMVNRIVHEVRAEKSADTNEQDT